MLSLIKNRVRPFWVPHLSGQMASTIVDYLLANYQGYTDMYSSPLLVKHTDTVMVCLEGNWGLGWKHDASFLLMNKKLAIWSTFYRILARFKRSNSFDRKKTLAFLSTGR